jgi:hypothetical protein
MPDQLELNWLVHERPQPLPLDAATTAKLRAELLDRRERDARQRRGQRAGLRSWVWRGLAGGVTLAGTAAAVLAVIGVGGQNAAGVLATRTPATKTRHVIANASAQRLTRLSVKLADEATQIGDATLVIRTQNYPDQPSITGADLYADNGNYYYSPTLAGLPAVIGQNETVNLGSSDSEQRDIAAANAALTEPIDQARQQMSVANLDPDVKPKEITPGVSPGGADTNAQAELQQKIRQVQQQDQKDDIKPVISQEDGMIWDNGMDALTAGAGNPQVRAGVLKLFATIPQITSSTGTLNGQQTLDVTASLLSSNSGLYQEQLVLNAETGVPLEMIGGNQGQTPSVTVYYTITRTTVAAVENGSAN